MEAICFPCRNGLVPDQPVNCASCLHEIIRFHVKHESGLQHWRSAVHSP